MRIQSLLAVLLSLVPLTQAQNPKEQASRGRITGNCAEAKTVN